MLDARDARCADATALRESARAAAESLGQEQVSRSYSFPLALVAGHTGAVGVDIERIEVCTGAFADSIRTPTERTAAATGAATGAAVDDRAVISLWSAKEALAKALGDALDYDPRRLEAPSAWPHGRSGPWRAAELDVGMGHVGWVCWCTAPSAPNVSSDGALPAVPAYPRPGH